MPLLGDTRVSHSIVDEQEAEVIVNEYFNYIEDIGLSFECFGLNISKNKKNLDVANIVESISNRLESACENMVY